LKDPAWRVPVSAALGGSYVGAPRDSELKGANMVRPQTQKNGVWVVCAHSLGHRKDNPRRVFVSFLWAALKVMLEVAHG
jgi:hypothetical protein